MHFEWDPRKAAKNVDQNRPTFEEAMEVFASDAMFLERQVIKNGEQRWFRIGQITRGVIVVVWTERDGDTIRIISARFASRAERAHFHRYLQESEGGDWS